VAARCRRRLLLQNYLGHYGGKLARRGDNQAPRGVARVDAVFDVLRFITSPTSRSSAATTGVQAILPVVNQSLSNRRAGRPRQQVRHRRHVHRPLRDGWHHSPELHTIAALDINLPTGAYDKNDPRTSIGANYYSYEPCMPSPGCPRATGKSPASSCTT
jgi:hypothetical protein